MFSKYNKNKKDERKKVNRPGFDKKCETIGFVGLLRYAIDCA